MRTDQDAVAMQAALDAMKDALSGWRYIRESHGDLYGVGWDRVEQKLVAAIAALPAALAAPCSCAGCSKKASEGWALYCVECAEQMHPPRVISDAEIVAEAGAFTRDAHGVANLIAFARAIIAKAKEKE